MTAPAATLTGKFVPWQGQEDSPVFLRLADKKSGALESPELHLVCFSSQSDLQDILGAAGGLYARVQQINNGPLFLDHLPRALVCDSAICKVIVVVDPFYNQHGWLQFTEVPRRTP